MVAKRDISGILLLDKPTGLSSNAALQKVKRLFQAKKAGHTGSLDPLASGLLPICFGEATKFSQYLLDADKCYLATAQLGVTTTTGDAEGEVLNRAAVPALSAQQLQQLSTTFTGPLKQVPPMYSALKHQGTPLYKLARQGIDIDRPPRDVTIRALSLASGETREELVLQVHCSKGTYIRSLVEDIGQAIGCGAHVTQLRRVSAGPFQAQQMLTLEALQVAAERETLADCLLPIDAGLVGWPRVNLSESGCFYLTRGRAIVAPDAAQQGVVCLQNAAGEFFGLGEVQADGMLISKRLLKTQAPACA